MLKYLLKNQKQANMNYKMDPYVARLGQTREKHMHQRLKGN